MGQEVIPLSCKLFPEEPQQSQDSDGGGVICGLRLENGRAMVGIYDRHGIREMGNVSSCEYEWGSSCPGSVALSSAILVEVLGCEISLTQAKAFASEVSLFPLCSFHLTFQEVLNWVGEWKHST